MKSVSSKENSYRLLASWSRTAIYGCIIISATYAPPKHTIKIYITFLKYLVIVLSPQDIIMSNARIGDRDRSQRT